MTSDQLKSDLAAQLDSLRLKKDWIEGLLIEEPADRASSESVRHLALGLREDEPVLSEFAEKLAEQIVNYCIPRRRREEALAEVRARGGDTAPLLALRRDARRLFMEYNKKKPSRSGEGGEILIYCLTEHFLEAPLVLAKMHLKTSRNMPVHGADGVHVRLRDEKEALEVIYLESKVHVSLSSAASSAADSMAEFVADTGQAVELRLAVDLGNLDGLEEPFRSQVLEYLDPYGKRTRQRRDRFACLLACEVLKYATFKGLGDEAEGTLRSIYASLSSEHKKTVNAAVEKHKELKNKVHAFIVALPSVAEFRGAFERALKNG